MLRHRLAVGIPLGLCAVAAFAWNGLPGALVFVVLAAVFVVVGVHEFSAMTGKMGVPGFPVLSSAAACVMFAACWRCGSLGAHGVAASAGVDALVFSVFVVVCALVVFQRGPTRKSLTVFLVAIGGLLYCVYSLLFIAKVYFCGGSNGRMLVLYLVVVTKLADVGAFTLGTITARRPGGNHKMAPKLSPKKSWEGLFGGTLASVAASLVFVLGFGDRLTLHGQQVLGVGGAILMGLAGSVVGLIGDLIESCLKRASETKDSGRIPGLGGVLDIVDSLIPMAPLFFGHIHLVYFLTAR